MSINEGVDESKYEVCYHTIGVQSDRLEGQSVLVVRFGLQRLSVIERNLTKMMISSLSSKSRRLKIF
jgi:hypothetical protein